MPLKALEYMAPACEWSVFFGDASQGARVHGSGLRVVGVPW